jgi:cell wall-associated NlpC family hydrolase
MRKIFTSAAAWSAGAALTLGAFAGAAMPANADPSETGTEPAPVACKTILKVYSTVKAGATGVRPNAAECLLLAAGFSATPDGAFGDDDVAATKKFQTSLGLAASGEVNRRTWTALVAQGTRPTLKAGKRGADVKRLQAALRAAGYTKVSSSGLFGSLTKAAVKGVQKSQKYRQTGVASASVWKALQAGKSVKVKTTTKKKSSSKGLRALAYAKRQLGDSYRYGAAGPRSWDCSGLTMKSWRSAGVRLPHSARGQYHRGKHVSRSHLRKGDLVFFYSGISHVGIYAGNGKIIHASRPGTPVGYIRISSMPYRGAVRLG